MIFSEYNPRQAKLAIYTTVDPPGYMLFFCCVEVCTSYDLDCPKETPRNPNHVFICSESNLSVYPKTVRDDVRESTKDGIENVPEICDNE